MEGQHKGCWSTGIDIVIYTETPIFTDKFKHS